MPFSLVVNILISQLDLGLDRLFFVGENCLHPVVTFQKVDIEFQQTVHKTDLRNES